MDPAIERLIARAKSPKKVPTLTWVVWITILVVLLTLFFLRKYFSN